MPSVKVTKNVYNSKSLKAFIDREHAMLNGVIMDNAGKSFKQPTSNLLSKVDMQQQNIKRIGKIAIRSLWQRWYYKITSSKTNT